MLKSFFETGNDIMLDEHIFYSFYFNVEVGGNLLFFIDYSKLPETSISKNLKPFIVESRAKYEIV